jgi:hypothetical protein
VAGKQFASSPGVTELRSSGLNAGSTTAFQQVSAGILGGTIGANRWTNVDDPYVQFLYAADSSAKNAAFQNIFRGLVDQKAPAGSGARNAWEYLQGTMRKIGLSSAKTTLGVPAPQDMTGLENVIRATIGSNATDPLAWLTAASMGYSGGKTIKQPDTTPQFNRQVQKALQLKDWGDAKNALYDTYYAAFGVPPTDDLVSKLETSWNSEMKAQTTAAVTQGKTTFKPIYDTTKPIYDKSKPVLTKGGKPKKDAKGNTIYQQKVDKDGNLMFAQKKNKAGVLQYESVYTATTTTEAEGFTAQEQEQFLADFLKSNFPQSNFTAENIGGAAKSIFDDLVNASKNNYAAVPSFDKISNVILSVIGSADENVAAEIIRKYKDDIRKETGKKFMSLAEDLAAGKDAKPIVQGLLTNVGNALETTIYEDDPLMKTILNFKDEKGNYRLPNDLELFNLVDNDPRVAYTSRKKNEAVDMAQTLRSRLQR